MDEIRRILTLRQTEALIYGEAEAARRFLARLSEWKPRPTLHEDAGL